MVLRTWPRLRGYEAQSHEGLGYSYVITTTQAAGDPLGLLIGQRWSLFERTLDECINLRRREVSASLGDLRIVGG